MLAALLTANNHVWCLQILNITHNMINSICPYSIYNITYSCDATLHVMFGYVIVINVLCVCVFILS